MMCVTLSQRRCPRTTREDLTPLKSFKRKAMRLGVIFAAFFPQESATVSRWPPQQDFSSIPPTKSDPIQTARAPIRTLPAKWKSRASTRKTLSGSPRDTLLPSITRLSRKHQKRSASRASTLSSLTSPLYTLP